MESLIKYVQDEYIDQKNFPEFKAGDTITVYYEIKEGEKSRTQFFKGVVIQIKGKGKTKTFTIRKMSGTFGIERIFPINLPSIKKIEINKKNGAKISLATPETAVSPGQACVFYTKSKMLIGGGWITAGELISNDNKN